MKKIFFACDTSSINTVKKIISQTKSRKLSIGYKFGLQFFYSKTGRKYISSLKGKLIWLDLKFKDIPNTVSSSIESLKDLTNINYLTVHCSGGFEMMKKSKIAVKKINRKLKILGVTVLTSFNEKSFKEVGFSQKIEKIVLQQARLARKAGLDGIVCSGYELKKIKKICKNMEIFVPGVRLDENKRQDQKRVVTPSKAFKDGASAIVVGRSVTQGNLKKNFQKLIKSID